MQTCVVNLFCALLALLFALDSQFDFPPSRYPSQGPHLPTTVSEILLDTIAALWVAGAVGLFFRLRLAWICSMIGVAASACFFATGLAIVIGIWLFLGPKDSQSDANFGITGVLATIITIILEVGGLSVLSAFFVALFIRLIKMRKVLT